MIDLVDTLLSIIFSILIILHVSWIILLLIPKKTRVSDDRPDVTVIIPAYNEEDVIAHTIESVLESDYPGKIQVIVVDDGSTDETGGIIRGLAKEDERITLVKGNHDGKALAINRGSKSAKYDILVVLDADSNLKNDGLTQMVSRFHSKDVGGVSGIIRAKITANPLTWFQDFEYIHSSAWRHICDKIGATYIFPGFAAFRKDAFEKIGGFSNDSLSEDFDIGVRLKKAGYHLAMSKAIIYTTVPCTLGGLYRQRIRWGRGTVQVMRKHKDVIFNRYFGLIGFYGFPTQMYWFFHCLVYIPIFIYQVTEGYFRYFFNKDVFWSYDVAKYFFGWFSIYGIIDFSQKTFAGEYEITTLFMLLFTMFICYSIYNILLAFWFVGFHPRYIFVFFFYFPYALISITLNTIPLISELLSPQRKNIWEKAK